MGAWTAWIYNGIKGVRVSMACVSLFWDGSSLSGSAGLVRHDATRDGLLLPWTVQPAQRTTARSQAQAAGSANARRASPAQDRLHVAERAGRHLNIHYASANAESRFPMMQSGRFFDERRGRSETW